MDLQLSDFFDEVNDAFRGTDDDAPSTGSTDYNMWLRVTNRKVRKWARRNKWASLWKPYAPAEYGTVSTTGTTTLTGVNTRFSDYRVGDKVTVSGETVRTIAAIASDTSLTVTLAFSNTASAQTHTHTSIIATAVQGYNLSRRFIFPSDEVIILATNSQEVDYTVVKPENRDTEFRACYVAGKKPQILTFEDTITSTSQIVGGTLQVPGYYLPDPLVNETDLIPVDDTDWLIYEVAGELAFNDLTYESKSADLILRANDSYKSMSNNNRRLTAGNPSKSRTNVTRIPGSNR